MQKSGKKELEVRTISQIYKILLLSLLSKKKKKDFAEKDLCGRDLPDLDGSDLFWEEQSQCLSLTCLLDRLLSLYREKKG